MKRRLFVQKSALVSSIAILTSPSVILAAENQTNEINISSFLSSGNMLKIKGKTIDSESKETIAAKISVKSGYGLFSKYREINLSNGEYSILEKLGVNDKNKIKVKVEAEGYKTYTGFLHLTLHGVAIDSDIWNYNPKFNPDNAPKTTKTTKESVTDFNFELVKA